jgi:peptide/nickel transport system ATP-binding protein
MAEEALLKVEDLRKYFPLRTGMLASILSKKQEHVKAVDGITFNLAAREILGIVGESGCGKTTTGRTILRLTEPTSGSIYFEGADVAAMRKSELRGVRRKMQMIFQDPYESLNPRRTVADTVGQSIAIHNLATSDEERETMIKETLEAVGLEPPEEFLGCYPHVLSGGQRQRVAIARTLVLHPKLIVADEPVSMLDVSTRSGILELIMSLRDELGISVLYITHDLATTRYVCNRFAVMYLGKIVELGDTDAVLENPIHPYTRALMSAVPVPDPTFKKTREKIPGEAPSPVNPPPGCRFHTRCRFAKPECSRQEPSLEEFGREHQVACLRPREKP